MPAFAAFHEMGLGKSLLGVAIMGRLFRDGKAARALVVAPASVVPVWEKELSAFADFPYRASTIKGTGAKRKQWLTEFTEGADADALSIAILNYESVGRSRELEQLVLAYAPEIVVADEAHRLKTPGAAQSKAFQRIGAAARYRIALTGTPISNSPLDVFGIYKFLAPSVFGTSYTAFKARYAHEVSLPGGGKFVTGMKPDMLAELTERAHSIAHRASKEDSLDLPAATDVERYCELDAASRRVYNGLAKESIALLDTGKVVVAQNVLTRLLRLQQLTGGFATDEDGVTRQIHTAKLRLLEEVLDEAPGKVVVFAKFTAEIDAIRDALADTPHVVVDGRTPMAYRGQIVEDFQTGKPRVFVAQLRAAGLGITLTAADTAVFYSNSHSLADYEQARGRIHRIGQAKNVTYVHLLARDTVDVKLREALAEKADLADLITNRWREVIGYGI